MERLKIALASGKVLTGEWRHDSGACSELLDAYMRDSADGSNTSVSIHLPDGEVAVNSAYIEYIRIEKEE